MNGCQGNTSACNGENVMPVKLGLARVLLLMCQGCRSTTLAIATIVERRIADVPVEVEQRRFRPAWLRNLTARIDDSWRVAS